MFVTLEQRVSTREAWRNWRLMVRALGEPAPGPLTGLRVPPSPERAARTPYEVFHVFGVERRRARERRGSDERMLKLLEPHRGHRARMVRLLMAGGPRG